MLRRWIFGVSQLSAKALQSEQKKWHAHSEWQQNKKFSFTFKFLIFCWEIFVTSILHRNYCQFQFLFEPLDDLNFLVLIKAIPSLNSLWSKLSLIHRQSKRGNPLESLHLSGNNTFCEEDDVKFALWKDRRNQLQHQDQQSTCSRINIWGDGISSQGHKSITTTTATTFVASLLGQKWQ